MLEIVDTRCKWLADILLFSLYKVNVDVTLCLLDPNYSLYVQCGSNGIDVTSYSDHLVRISRSLDMDIDG